ncbi:hypothetical protein TgHK011_002055 [Trichoderma gracile]|nr:hypothetical protein TgHK011_002055 [Trichoderma gracile]
MQRRDVNRPPVTSSLIAVIKRGLIVSGSPSTGTTAACMAHQLVRREVDAESPHRRPVDILVSTHSQNDAWPSGPSPPISTLHLVTFRSQSERMYDLGVSPERGPNPASVHSLPGSGYAGLEAAEAPCSIP